MFVSSVVEIYTNMTQSMSYVCQCNACYPEQWQTMLIHVIMVVVPV